MASNGPLTLTIRFAASLPDLSLSIPSPNHTSTLALATLIRPHLSPTHSSLRLRLIHAGRVLQPTDSLTASLRLPRPPPADSPVTASAKAKGKAAVRPNQPAAQPAAIYVHATFSDALTPALLDAEQEDALAADAALASTTPPVSPRSKRGLEAYTPSKSSRRAPPPSPITTSNISAAAGPSTRNRTAFNENDAATPLSSLQGATTTTAAPQGFDRLLAAGLSPLEVASLRSQFVAILAHTHTPDTMPGAAELRALEEAWLDNDSEGRVQGAVTAGPDDGAGGMFGAGGGGGGGAGGLFGGIANVAAAGGAGGGDEDTGGLEDMLWGNIMGFFWPVGAVVWLMREEGVWSQRRRVAVVTGALVNLAFSVMRAAS